MQHLCKALQAAVSFCEHELSAKTTSAVLSPAMQCFQQTAAADLPCMTADIVIAFLAGWSCVKQSW